MEIQAHARDSVRDAKTGALRKELQALKQKEESKPFALYGSNISLRKEGAIQYLMRN